MKIEELMNSVDFKLMSNYSRSQAEENIERQSEAFFERRTSNDEIGEFMLRDRSAPLFYKLAEYLIQNSTLDVRRS